MQHSFKFYTVSLCLASLAAFGCKEEDNGGDTDSTTETLQPIEGALGRANRPDTPASARIDRAGRPAITAALISTFNPDAQEDDLDRYNKSGNANSAFVPIMEASLGILDGLDRNCGNQLLAGANPDQRRYQPLATALVDDQVYVQSDRPGSGSVYLGVEAETLGAIGAGQGSGGGRVPGDDVIERSYSVLAAGALRGIDDGVGSDDAQHDIDTFPFLAGPQ
jgi:hypothetical protein